LRYQGLFGANKNKILNADFNINQRGFTTSTTSGAYTFDRWITEFSGVTTTYSTQAFTPGAAPVAGYEGTNFARVVTSSAGASSYALLGQRIEDVRTFAGQTITVSLWAKATSGTPKISIRTGQIFGSGGSGVVTLNATSAATISTSWARYSFTLNIASISGKTIGSGSYLSISIIVDDDLVGTGVGIQNNTFDIWGVQAEAGSVATPFQTATGTIQGELSACRRYLPAYKIDEVIGYAYATNAVLYAIQFDTPARVAPTGVTCSGTFNAYALNTPTVVTPTFNTSSVNNATVAAAPAITAGQGSRLGSGGLILFTGCEL
jgi:hypothetical protein